MSSTDSGPSVTLMLLTGRPSAAARQLDVHEVQLLQLTAQLVGELGQLLEIAVGPALDGDDESLGFLPLRE